MIGRFAIILMLVPALSCSTRQSRSAVEPPGVHPNQKSASRTQVVLLGTGTPNADPDRSGPALAVVVNGQAYLVDCGPGIVRRAAAARRA